MNGRTTRAIHRDDAMLRGAPAHHLGDERHRPGPIVAAAKRTNGLTPGSSASSGNQAVKAVHRQRAVRRVLPIDRGIDFHV